MIGSSFIRPYFLRSGSQLYINATGGTITRDGNYLIHVINEGDTFEITQLADNPAFNELEVKLIGGGGGGAGSSWAGNAVSGGGGAGEWLPVVKTAEIKSYSFTIGAAGVGNENAGNGTNGGDTIFEGSTAHGGGGGGSNAIGLSGASGGGGSQNKAGGTGNYGYNGGSSTNINNSAAGGGGAGGVAPDAGEDSFNSPGGAGITSSITGTSIIYCQGGAGNVFPSTSASLVDGPTGLGWGGGGADANTGIGRGGNGSSGSIIIKYYCPVNYYFRIDRLTDDTGFPWLDSSLFYPLDANTLAAFGGYNNVDYLPDQVTDLWWTTSDGITWNEESPLPVGPSSHIIAGLREDGLIWLIGKSQNLPGPVVEFWVCTLDPDTKNFTIIDSNATLPGGYGYAQWGFFHKDEIYAAFSTGTNCVIKKTSDGINWTDVSTLPDYTFDSSAWSDGTRIRYAGGGQDIAASPITNPVTGVYESLDDGETWSLVSALPSDMQSIWPSYYLFNGYEFYINGAWGPSNSDWGQVYYRQLGSGTWTKAIDVYERFDLFCVYPRHASSVVEFKNKLFLGLGTFANCFKIDRL